jgi:hypothetical protein
MVFAGMLRNIVRAAERAGHTPAASDTSPAAAAEPGAALVP